jgi:ElaB/YqjD/DUF883 family membrane-anchored ribosome-binding protein
MGLLFARQLLVDTNIESTLNQTADEAATAVSDVTSRVADYVRDLDAREMLKEAESWAKEHPGAALAGAVAVGFIAGRLLRR